MSFDVHTIAKQGRITRNVEARNVMAGVAREKCSPRLHQRPLRHDCHRGGQSTTNAGNRGRDGISIVQPIDPDAPNDSPAPGVNDDGSGTALT